ncbi:MAG TPA: hypothetical protein GX016_09265 [Firmicutes bacterium]|nr:hypothetical protein [Bacillota bacterium]
MSDRRSANEERTRASKDKSGILTKLPPTKRVFFLQCFFTSGGTPPAREQSARADALAYLLNGGKLPAKALARQLKRRWDQNN